MYDHDEIQRLGSRSEVDCYAVKLLSGGVE